MPTETQPEPTETPIEAFTVESDIVIPFYQPLDLPYSEWEATRSQELLTANGYGATLEEWRQAAGHANGLLRGAAYYLLTRHPEERDEGLFRQGLADLDEHVQVIAAYGLYRLGDSSALPILERIAGYAVGAHTAAARAAGILGELGDPTAFATIQKAMQSEQRYVRLFAIENALPFVPLHGQLYAPGKTIDIWGLYRQALQDVVDQVRSVARLQLLEVDTPEARELLNR